MPLSPRIVSSLSISKLFLIDGIGALVSAFFLGIVLVKLETLIGMPVNTLYLLASLALLFAGYSLSCYFSKSSNQLLLRIISVINCCYCILTLSLVIVHFQGLTLLGIAYFALEMLVIISLVRIEWRFSSKSHAAD